MAKYPKNNTGKYVKVVSEKECLGKAFPSFYIQIKGLKLNCRGWIQPFDQSEHYRVEIEYIPWNSPRVRILEPKIDANVTIHMYSDGTICLYDWREQPWQQAWHIHETIIPWVAEWIVFYELFLLTGKWHGISVAHVTEKAPYPFASIDRD